MDKDFEKQTEQKPQITKETPINTTNEHAETFMAIKRVTAWVMIMSAILFALIGVLAIWEVFGKSAGDVVWRAFSSLAIIAFAALVVNVASRAMMSKH